MKRTSWKSLAAGLALGLTALPAAAQAPKSEGIELVTLPSKTTPLVSIRLLFRVGSMHDPAGKEGLAALTQRVLSQGATKKRSYATLLNDLYPTAASINAFTDREVTVISGTVHREKLAEYTALLKEVLLEPAFLPEDFERNREQTASLIANSLRGGSDETLGLEMIQQLIFSGHPYGHAPVGTIAGLKAITLDDVKNLYKQQYSQANLMLGVAGGYPDGFAEKLAQDLAAVLPAGQRSSTTLPKPAEVEGRQVTLIDKKTSAVGIHFGYPIAVNRLHPDFYPLFVANSFLGEHRTSFGRLMDQLREKRGLNYGDYSYIEYWQNPPFTNTPPPNVPRQQQYFSVWVRPVVPGDAQFALRAALYEVGRLREKGMTQKEFEDQRNLLLNFTKLWAQSVSERLGFLMDSRYYGTPYYIDEIDAHLRKLKLEDVNRVIRQYIRTDDMRVLLIADGAEALKKTLTEDAPSVKQYPAKVEPEVTEADKTIQVLKVAPASVTIVPVAELFEKK